jgi:hypothetical protein
MFDNLRDLSNDPLYDDQQNQDDGLFEDMEDDAEVVSAPVTSPVRKQRKSKNFLGMTAQQRFLISVMLLFTVCLLGTLVMFVLGRMSIF